jgi:hypothetical protein
MAGTASFDRERAFKEALGTAVAHVWAELRKLCKRGCSPMRSLLAVAREQDESLREELARYLHEHHPRTAYKR